MKNTKKEIKNGKKMKMMTLWEREETKKKIIESEEKERNKKCFLFDHWGYNTQWNRKTFEILCFLLLLLLLFIINYYPTTRILNTHIALDTTLARNIYQFYFNLHFIKRNHIFIINTSTASNTTTTTTKWINEL